MKLIPDRSFTAIAVQAVVMLSLTLAASTGFAANRDPSDNVKTIRVVMDDNYPPYVFKGEQGELKGIIVDQWRLWEKKTGITALLTGTDWAEAQRRMQAGEFDVIDTIFRSEQREATYDFTKPYAQLDVPLFFHEDISGIRGPEDLKGFLVAAKSGDNSIDILKKHGVTSIIEYSSYEKLLEAARDGKARVFTVDRPPALYYLNKFGIENRFHETKPLYQGEFHRAVRKGETALLSAVEEGFAAISRQEYAAIDQHWLGADISSTPYFRYTLYGASVIASVFLGLLLWLRALKRAVAEKTAELTKSNEVFSLFMRHSPIYTYIKEVSPAGVRVLQASENFQEMVGIPGSKMNGKMMAELFPGEFAAKIDADDRAVVAGGEVLRFEEELNGRSYSTIKFPLLQGERALLAGFTIDVTEQKWAEEALRQSEATFRKLFEASSDAILLIDASGVFVECNQAALDLLKMTREEFIFLPPVRISPEFQPNGRRSDEAALDMIAQAYSKGLHRFDWTCVNNEGGEFIVEVSLMPIVIKGQTMLHTTWRDITGRKKAEAALRESDERFRTLFDYSPDPVWIIDSQRFIDCNQAAVDILGYPDKEVLRNTHPSELSPEFQPDGEPSFSKAEHMMLVAREKGLHRFEWVHRRRDQTDFFAEVTLSVLTLQGRQVLYCTWRDITERKRVEESLRESESRFRLIFELSPDPLIISRIANGGILAVNRSFTLHTGIAEAEALGKNGLELNLWADVSERDEFLQTLARDGAVSNMETRFRVQQGEIRVGLTSAQMILTDEGPCMLIAIRDITSQKQAESVLKEMDRIKSEFISTAAHELRTPLSVILGYTELLRSPHEFGDFPEESKRNFIDEIYLKCDTLSLIIDEMLDISRIESGHPISLDVRPYEPVAWLKRVISRFELQGPRHTFRLRADGPQPPLVRFDLHRLTQVIENLLSNALKYSPRGGEIAVSSEICANDYVVRVADQGIGMTPDQVARIFDKFWRADASNTAIGGLGLGMSIARQIVENHGGRIWVESSPGVGTTVSFSVPLD